jgi:hypothetical protein
MVTDPTGTVRRTAVTDGAGSFRIRDLAPGQYELVASLPGFATILNQVALVPGENAQLRLPMRIGMLEEAIRVVCAAGGAVLTPDAQRIPGFDRANVDMRALRARARGFADAARRAVFPIVEAQSVPVRVGGQIKAPQKTFNVNPVCPRLLLPSMAVAVNLEATIGTDGFVKDVRFLAPGPGSEQPQPEFVESATEAVRQWRFTPTLLNNVPVPVLMSVRVDYRRM